jgi:alcohol dehydrogenase class IV
LPDVAILDAALTIGLPASITAMTGIDAMVHAIEAYTVEDQEKSPSQTCLPYAHSSCYLKIFEQS